MLLGGACHGRHAEFGRDDDVMNISAWMMVGVRHTSVIGMGAAQRL